MNIYLRTASILCLALLSACASPKFKKDGATNQDLARDWTECETKFGQSGQYLTAGYFQRRSFMNRCMLGFGYEEAD